MSASSVRFKEKIGKAIFAAAAIICVACVVAIFSFLIIRSAPAFAKLGVFEFVFGSDWSPDRFDTYDSPLSGTYGILTMIAGTLAATAGALLIGGVLGYFTAVFIVFYCPKKLRRILSTVINLLAGIPSVVYGFFGISFLLPILSYISPNNGSGLLATSIILGIMILPSVVSLSSISLEAVPSAYYQGSLALGATRTETVFRIMSPAARSGIAASLVLGAGRALGETMAVVMVAGNAPTYPSGLFNSFRVLSANIVMEMGYSGEVQEGALVATGVVLLLFVLAVNMIFGLLSGRAVTAAVKHKKKERHSGTHKHRTKNAVSAFMYKIRAVRIGQIMSMVSGVFVGAALVLVVGFIFANGLPYLIQNPSIIYRKYEFASENITIFPAIITTLWAVAISLIVAVPVGVMSAIFLSEYAKSSTRTVRIIRTAIDILAGVPSIVYGLFGMLSFVALFGGSSSILAGSLTVGIMLLPPIVRSVEESLHSVPHGLREGSLALGAGKLRTVFKIVLPSALSGILSAVILSIGRVIGESAPLLYTMGSVISAVPRGFLDSGATLAVALYQLSGEGWYIKEAYATAVVLIVLVLLLNLAAEWGAGKLSKKLKGNTNGK